MQHLLFRASLQGETGAKEGEGGVKEGGEEYDLSLTLLDESALGG